MSSSALFRFEGVKIIFSPLSLPQWAMPGGRECDMPVHQEGLLEAVSRAGCCVAFQLPWPCGRVSVGRTGSPPGLQRSLLGCSEGSVCASGALPTEIPVKSSAVTSLQSCACVLVM